MAPPVNDNFADAIAVAIASDGGTYTATPVDNREATLETGEPYIGSRSVWYSYTPATSGSVNVTTAGSIKISDSTSGDTVLAVYTGTAVNALTLVAYDDDGGPGSNSTLTYSATGGTTYHIVVAAYNSSGLSAELEYHLAVTGPATATPGQITGVTAAATATAWPAPFPPVSVNVDGEPATATADARPATDVRAYDWAATATAAALPAKPPYDDIGGPLTLTGGSGTGNLNALGATREAGEPGGIVGPATAESLWLRYTPTVPGDFTITVPAGVSAEIWEGTDYTDPVYVAGATGTVSAALAASVAYSIRIAPTTVGAIPPSVAYSWGYAERIAELVLNVDDTELEDTPTTVAVSVLNGTPDGPVTFSFDGTVIYSDTFDGSGVIADLDLAIPVTSAGTYTLLVTDTTNGFYDNLTLTVLDDPLDEPADLPETADPTINPAVLRWVVQDPHGAVADYVFPINPKEMTTPFGVRTLTAEVTTSPDGQPLVWEGAFRPYSWQFSGHIETQAHYEALEGYAASNQRWWIIDHRLRGWLVTFEAFEPTLRTRTDPAAPYRSTYVMRCLTYAGPVTP